MEHDQMRFKLKRLKMNKNLQAGKRFKKNENDDDDKNISE